MDFWGLEVPSGEKVNVKVGAGRRLAIRQACIAASMGGVEERVIVVASQNNQEMILGILHPEKQTQQEVNQLFGEDVTLYHTWKKGSVYLVGNFIDEEQMAPKEEELKNGGGWMLYNRMFKTKTLPAIAVGAVCMAASWVVMHPRK